MVNEIVHTRHLFLNLVNVTKTILHVIHPFFLFLF